MGCNQAKWISKTRDESTDNAYSVLTFKIKHELHQNEDKEYKDYETVNCFFIGFGRKLKGDSQVGFISNGFSTSMPFISYKFEIPLSKTQMNEMLNKDH